jgi:hypothetical protein
MMRREHDDEAVSAAIATVLLFAGVITIISGMMVTVMPVIDELHGAVERENMVGQMDDLAAETSRLSESGTPGDSATMNIRPHTGSLSWELLEGGTWYSATHQPDSEFRLEGVLDLDNQMRLRHAEYHIESICTTDLHASAESLHHYRIPMLNGTITATPINALTTLLGSNQLTHEVNGSETDYTMATDDVWSTSVQPIEGETWIHSKMPMRVVMWRGEGGAFLATPDQTIPGTETGRSWSIPLISGSHAIHIEADSPFTIEWNTETKSGQGSSSSVTVAQTPSGEQNLVHIWNGEVEVNQLEQLALRTSTNARAIIHWGDAVELDGVGPGAVPWLDRAGAATGVHFRPPAMDGSLIIHNPSDDATTAKVNNLFHSIGGQSSIRIPWDSGDLSWVEGSDPIQIEWVLDAQTIGNTLTHSNGWRPGSMALFPASDTGRMSGNDWKFESPTSGGNAQIPALGTTMIALQSAGPSASWSTQTASGILNHEEEATTLTLENGHIGHMSIESTSSALRAYIATGIHGSTEVIEDGAERCVNIDLRASGWIDVELPWNAVGDWRNGEIRNAWKDGSHFFGISLTLRGNVGDEPHVTIGSAWAMHLPRLTYTFDSSVTDLQILTHGGFVGTNHPEYRADVLIPPPSREGPGPRLAATVPVTMPTTDSVVGNSELEFTLTLDVRDQVTTMNAHEVRRGWDGPYAVAIAAESSAEVEFSSDWLAFPGQLDMLDDYVGWVQTSPTMPEVVYHAGGQPVLFNLQVASLSCNSITGGGL